MSEQTPRQENKLQHPFSNIRYIISIILFVVLVSSSTTAFFHTETGMLEGNIMAADTFAEPADDGVEEKDETSEDVAENELDKELTDDADEPIEKGGEGEREDEEAKENEEDENEDAELIVDE